MGADRGIGSARRGRAAALLLVAMAAALLLVAMAAAAALTACDPVDGLGASAVSVITGQLATHALTQDGVAVQWLSCSASSSGDSARVDCQGRTDDRRQISVKGTITEQLDGACVRGRLAALVGGRTVFDVGGPGDCDRPAPARG